MEAFGQTIRTLRQERKLGLRQLARIINVSPTFLSRLEHNEASPPGEPKIIALATALGQDKDILLALAGKVSTDLQEAIRARPQLMADLIRAARDMPEKELSAVLNQMNP